MTRAANANLAGNPAESNPAPKGSGKLKDTLSLASTALPIAGAVGTLAVWIAANFYVGEVQITPDRPFSTLEVRVSDKKGQESVFHTPHFQLMPGKYHLEVTVDSHFKHHADIKAAFQKSTNILVHVPAGENVPPATEQVRESQQQVTLQGAAGQTDVSAQPSEINNKNKAIEEDWGAEPADVSKKHWWQFWRKSPPANQN